MSDIPQQARAPHRFAKEFPVPVSSETIRVRGRVERPCLLARRALRDLLEVVGVDDGVEAGLFVELQLWGGGQWGFGPFVSDGAFVDCAFEA